MGQALIVFFCSMGAAVAEFVLYMILGLSLGAAGHDELITGLAGFFMLLVIATLGIGVIYPICTLIRITRTKLVAK